MRLTAILAPYDSGRLDVRMGAGPRHLIANGLPERLHDAGHELEVREVLLGEGFLTEVTAGVEIMRRTAEEVAAALERDRLPLLLSGNCGSNLGLVSALGPSTTGLLWFDAHGDLNTAETTPSGYFDGMGYAMILGHGWQQLATTVPGFEPLPGPQAALLGARDLDPGEKALIETSGMLYLSPDALREDSAAEALAALAGRVERLHIHVDPDVFDPEVLRGNHLPVPGGLAPHEILAAARAALEHTPLAGLSVGSYAPEEDDPEAGVRVLGEVLLGLLEAAADRASD